MTENDILYFAVMYPFQPFEEPIFVKAYTKEDQDSLGCLEIYLTREDTINLSAGVYYYTVKLFTADLETGEFVEVQTAVERTKFVVYE